MNRSFAHILLLVALLCGVAVAQTDSKISLADMLTGDVEAEGVRSPYYDEAGNLRALLYGRSAKALKNEVADITDLRIDVYEEGKVSASIYAPQCLMHAVERGETTVLVVESDGEVLIELEGVTITGRGFRFRSDQQRFEILEDAKIVVDESAREASEINL